MSIAKVQHYVPQFLLRNFGVGKKDQIWVYDKTSSRSFLTHAKNIASESRFYDFELDGQPITLEPYLSKVESAAKPVLNGILRNDSLANLRADEREILAHFFSIQLTRTRAFREQWDDFPKILRAAFEERGDQIADGSQAAELLRDFSENDSKVHTGKFMLEAPETFAQHFLSKDWVLASTTWKHPFLTSDNPLVLQNSVDRPHRGNLGLTVPGIEIYLPLSPLRALAMWCPSLTKMVRDAVASQFSPVVGQGGRQENDCEGALALAEAFNSGGPVSYSKENVENFNSLQISRSERYIFSSVDDFHLAKEMLSSYPDLKRGPRIQVAS
jgi:hypothetical protein